MYGHRQIISSLREESCWKAHHAFLKGVHWVLFRYGDGANIDEAKIKNNF